MMIHDLSSSSSTDSDVSNFSDNDHQFELDRGDQQEQGIFHQAFSMLQENIFGRLIKKLNCRKAIVKNVN
jgi:hypothetical protein